MLLAMNSMSPTTQGILYLIAVVLFVVAAVVARPTFWACLVAAGLACAFFVPMWQAFAAS